MFFNSLDFAIFLPIVFVLYWFVLQKNLKLQNALIVVASYVFYAWWDWRFLSLIIFSTVVDYLVGQKLRTEEQQSKRKVLLWTSILVNLGFLGFFKYYNFFLENFVDDFRIRLNKKNASLYITYPSFQASSFDNNIKQIKKVEDELINSGFELLGYPERYRMNDSLMFDTTYHLSKKGVDLRTQLLIEDIKKSIKN
jgi:D-alanyl-lipoteichoic acid acyltransferase DltB (MBOAT superfamily)